MENENEISGGVSTVGIDLIHPITKSIDKPKQKGGEWGGQFSCLPANNENPREQVKKKCPNDHI